MLPPLHAAAPYSNRRSFWPGLLMLMFALYLLSLEKKLKGQQLNEIFGMLFGEGLSNEGHKMLAPAWAQCRGKWAYLQQTMAPWGSLNGCFMQLLYSSPLSNDHCRWAL